MADDQLGKAYVCFMDGLDPLELPETVSGSVFPPLFSSSIRTAIEKRFQNAGSRTFAMVRLLQQLTGAKSVEKVVVKANDDAVDVELIWRSWERSRRMNF